GHLAAKIQKAIDIKNRDGNDGTPRGLEQIAPQQPPNGFDAIHLIAVHTRHQEQHRARLLGPNNVDRHIDDRARRQLRDNQP
nr:hypothetical protein [Tanacetum cinerariifolium]